ncbi:MAG: transglycosylase SLT domain-containing protein [Deltaproteobacteria bacterium]|nr:transglycosylase SLT domain-containing protein [Deltaproteobacteria bacterium]
MSTLLAALVALLALPAAAAAATPTSQPATAPASRPAAPQIDTAMAALVDTAIGAAVDDQSVARLDRLIAATGEPELRAALLLFRGRQIERLRGPAAALQSLRRTRVPDALAPAWGDERLRLARAADDYRLELELLKGRLPPPGNRKRRALALQIVDLGLRSQQRGLIDKAAAALDPGRDADLTAILAIQRDLLGRRQKPALEQIAATIELAGDGHAVRRLDDLVAGQQLDAALVAKLGRAATLKWCERLAAAGRPERAAALMDLLPRADDLLPLRLRTLTAMRDYQTALATADLLLAQNPDQAGVALERARVLGRLGRPDEARAAYQDFAARFKSDPGVDQASFMAAWLLHESGRSAEAARKFKQVLDARPRSRLSAKLRWFWAFDLYRAGDLKASLTAFDAVQKAGGELAVSARYFKARALGRLGRQREAIALLDALVNGPIAPSNKSAYYRALARAARERIASFSVGSERGQSCGVTGYLEGAASAAMAASGEPIDGAARPSCPPELRSTVTALLPLLPPAPGRALAAAATVRLCDVAARVLRVTPRPAGDEGARRYLEALQRAGDASTTMQIGATIFRDQISRPAREEERWLWQTAYPQAPFLVDPSLERVPSALRHAVSRQESRFAATVISPAGAVGALQLLPRTAVRLGTMLGRPLRTADELLEPSRNAELGVYYLELLWREYRGALPLVVAAYNAGPPAVSNWLVRFHGLPLDEFVESIPFQETRGYVKKVLASYTVYGWLAGDPDAEAWARQECFDPYPRFAVDF